MDSTMIAKSDSSFAAEYAPLVDKIRALSPDRYDNAVFRHPMSFYRDRIDLIGAAGFARVLDAGHGFGQWSISLAEKNGHVTGIDHNKPRCDISLVLKEHYGVENFDVVCEGLDKLDERFNPESFDMIWCWGVIMFTNRRKVMKSFNRLLAPNGRLFLGAVNSPARWAFKYVKGWKDGIKAPNFYKSCMTGIRGSNNENGINAFGFTSARRIGEIYGFRLDEIGYDGEIDISGNKKVLRFEKTPLKIFQNIELTYTKTSPASAEA